MFLLGFWWGVMHPPPHEFSGMVAEPLGGSIALKFCIAYGASLQNIWQKNDRVRSGYRTMTSQDVGTASDRHFKEIVFSAMGLAAID